MLAVIGGFGNWLVSILVRSEKTIKKRRLFVKVSKKTLGSGKQITITCTWKHTDGMNEIQTIKCVHTLQTDLTRNPF